jgi:pyridoxal phosphate enzyme (YggS family)
VSDLAANVAALRQRIDAAASVAGRRGDEITLIGVSKTFPREDVDAAYRAGIRVFGENRVQEAQAKFAVPLPADAEVHLIGQLQTNKVKHALATFTCVQSVDRLSLIEALAREVAKRDVRQRVLVQVNIAGEAQKSGCAPDEAASLLEAIATSDWLSCEGFMTIAPLVTDPEDARPAFAGLRDLRDQIAPELPVLSMGMSGDFEVAIEEGATHVRIGRAVFGNR